MLPEIEKIFKVVTTDIFLKEIVTAKVIAQIPTEGSDLPIHAFFIGNKMPDSPTLIITGGFHGLERIGSQLAWSFLKSTVDRLLWDESLQYLFSKIRLVVIPLVNPYGYLHFKRSNRNNVDLMRNSPIRSTEKVPFLVGGQKFSSFLPWYMGDSSNMEIENESIISIFKKDLVQSRSLISIDFHSGFGMKDRLWFPWANSNKPFPHLPELKSLTTLFEQTHPYHIYQIEPQGAGYLIQGDFWDFLYQIYLDMNPSGIYIPLTLEMGSWSWVKKNPLQIFSKTGAFNPIKEHRIRRTYRRHHLLFDFLLKSLFSDKIWSQLDPQIKTRTYLAALDRWYG